MFAQRRVNKALRWFDRDGDRWGEYLSTTEVPGISGATYSVALLSDEPTLGQCALNIRFRSDAHDAQARFYSLRKVVESRLLPSVHAGDIVEGDFLE
jgi:hypothetical protein